MFAFLYVTIYMLRTFLHTTYTSASERGLKGIYRRITSFRLYILYEMQVTVIYIRAGFVAVKSKPV